MRTSYRCPGLRFSRKYHESVPWLLESVGNEALSCVRSMPFDGERRSRPRSSKVESLAGRVTAEGAMKMVFSTLALATERRDTM